MGLLDSLFNQSTYGGQGGGLLDFLRQSQMQQEQYQPSAGFPGQASPMNVGGYQMPRIGDQAQFTQPAQDPAAIPQNAQPTQGQMPQSPDIGERLLGGLRAFGNPGGFLNKIADAGTALSGGSTQANQTAQYLVSKGIDPAMAKTIVADPSLLRSVLPSLMGTAGTTNDIKEFERAQKDPAFAKFLQQKRATSGEFGMQPIWGMKDGKPAIIQLGKSGEAKESVLPPGFSPARDPIRVDGPTGTTILDPQTRQKIDFIPKDVAGKEALEKTGQAKGTAQAALANGADLDAEATKKKIDELLSNKGFESIFGSVDQYRPAWTLDSSGKDARTRFEQLKGTAFLSAYAMLKGGGAITDIEGQKAGAAMARLDRSLSEDEAKQALQDFKEAVDMGLKKLRRAANGGAEPAAPASTAAPKRIRLNADGTIAQ